MRATVLRATIAVVVIAAAVAFGLFRLQPPAHDIGDGFECARALTHLRVIAQSPHPIGSPENDLVRTYLVEQLKSLGLEVRVQEGDYTNPSTGRKFSPRNVLARLKGSARVRGAVMLSAHYDSVSAGPGASDDGAAVAALLEVAQVLASDRADRPLKRDVIFLFTDGEERGLLGARVFVRDDPWRADVALALNFEARGTSGPSTMFQTSSRAAWLVDQYAQAAPHPVTTSLFAEVYRRMPNDTDLTVLMEAGISGMNFAYIGSYQNYHTPTDDVEHTSERSLRHHGTQALALARRFADISDLPQAIQQTSVDAVYCDVWGFFVLRYPTWLAAPLALLAGVVAMAPVLRGLRLREYRLRGVLGGIAVGLLSIAVCSALVYYAHNTAARMRSPRALSPYFAGWYAGAVGLEVLIAVLVCRLSARKLSIDCIVMSMLLLWVVLALATGLAFPVASYVFVVPVALVGAATCINTRPSRFAPALALCAIAAALNAGHLFLGGLGVTLAGLHLMMLLVGLFVWLIVPAVMRAVQAAHGYHEST